MFISMNYGATILVNLKMILCKVIGRCADQPLDSRSVVYVVFTFRIYLYAQTAGV